MIYNKEFDAIWFNHTQSLEGLVELVYKIEIDTWSGSQKLKLYIESARRLS